MPVESIQVSSCLGLCDAGQSRTRTRYKGRTLGILVPKEVLISL